MHAIARSRRDVILSAQVQSDSTHAPFRGRYAGYGTEYTAERESLMIGLLMMLAVATPGSYKLILVVNSTPVVIDYPSSDRCERALRAAKEAARAQWEQSQQNLPPGAIITKPALVATGMCIPA